MIQRHIQEKRRADAESDLAHFLPDRVSLCDPKFGTRIADVQGAVIALDCCQGGDAGHDSFWSAGESGEKMGLDKPRDDPYVGFDEMTIDEGGSARSRMTKLDVRRGIFGIVIHAPVLSDDFRGEHGLQFCSCIATMSACAVQECDVLPARAGVTKIIKQPGNEAVVRCRAGKIRVDDTDRAARPDGFSQRCGADRRVERLDDGGALIRAGLAASQGSMTVAESGKFTRILPRPKARGTIMAKETGVSRGLYRQR